jgi:hypothetical protein
MTYARAGVGGSTGTTCCQPYVARTATASTSSTSGQARARANGTGLRRCAIQQSLSLAKMTSVRARAWRPGDHHDLKSALFQDLEDGDPIDPGQLHGDRLDPTAREPVCQSCQVIGKGTERPHRLFFATRQFPNRDRPKAAPPASPQPPMDQVFLRGQIHQKAFGLSPPHHNRAVCFYRTGGLPIRARFYEGKRQSFDRAGAAGSSG